MSKPQRYRIHYIECKTKIHASKVRAVFEPLNFEARIYGNSRLVDLNSDVWRADVPPDSYGFFYDYNYIK